MNTIAKSNQDAKLRKAAFKAMESIGNHDSIQVLVDLILTRDALLRSAQRSLKRMCLKFSAPEFFWSVLSRRSLRQSRMNSASGLFRSWIA